MHSCYHSAWICFTPRPFQPCLFSWLLGLFLTPRITRWAAGLLRVPPAQFNGVHLVSLLGRGPSSSQFATWIVLHSTSLYSPMRSLDWFALPALFSYSRLGLVSIPRHVFWSSAAWIVVHSMPQLFSLPDLPCPLRPTTHSIYIYIYI